MIEPVHVLIRTSGRPKAYKRLMDSIRIQTYPNIIPIIHIDESITTTYVEETTIVSSIGRQCEAPYNLYCNELLRVLPEGLGWYHFIDDDDYYTGPNVIEELVENSLMQCINVGKIRKEGVLVPTGPGGYPTGSFFLHTVHKDVARWVGKKMGDHRYTRALNLPPNFINIVIAECPIRGHGERKDIP